jgi:tRNA threonylcarbamoyl adenosine modification protein (Sua5/YciO/YrdC/YwlC family)
MTRVIKHDPQRPDPSLAAEIALVLDQDGVVSLPTDTVYGLCCRADRPRAVKRIYRIKGRDRKKPLVLFVQGPDALDRYGSAVGDTARRLAATFWPGPLTIVVKAAPLVLDWKLGLGGTIGMRAVAHPLVPELIALTGVPLASTSANRSGEPDASSGIAVLRALGGDPDLVVDGGELPRNRISTVVAVTGSNPVLLRRGSIGRAALQDAAGTTVKQNHVEVLFVCTGNTCRSPMAEGYLRQALDKQWRESVTIGSCGTSALPGMPATNSAQAMARADGFTISDHRSRLLTAECIGRADVIIAMEDRHRQEVLRLSPGASVALLVADGVPDPIGGTPDDYRQTLGIIKNEMAAVIEMIRALLP